MPTQQAVVAYTLGVMVTWTNRELSTLMFDTHLTDDLNLTETRRRTITGALRSYIQRYRENQTLLVSDVKRAKILGTLVQTMVARTTGTTIIDSRARTLIQSVIND